MTQFRKYLMASSMTLAMALTACGGGGGGGVSSIPASAAAAAARHFGAANRARLDQPGVRDQGRVLHDPIGVL